MSVLVVAPRHEEDRRDVFTTLSTPRAKYSKSRGSGSSGTGESQEIRGYCRRKSPLVSADGRGNWIEKIEHNPAVALCLLPPPSHLTLSRSTRLYELSSRTGTRSSTSENYVPIEKERVKLSSGTVLRDVTRLGRDVNLPRGKIRLYSTTWPDESPRAYTK